jgi:hypothetical protein
MSNDMPSSKLRAVIKAKRHIVQQHLAISGITEIASQEPIACLTLRGLSFAAANAIVYGCTTFTALRFIFVNIDQDVQSIDLATDMKIAAIVALIGCFLTFVFGR